MANFIVPSTTTVSLGQATSANSLPVVVSSDQPIQTSGGMDGYRILSANNTTTLTVKGSAGQVYYIHATNTNAAARFVKLYNSTTAAVGTTTPTHTFMIPGNANGAGMVLSIDKGQAYGTGIQVGITTGVADNDTGAPASNEVIVNIGFK